MYIMSKKKRYETTKNNKVDKMTDEKPKFENKEVYKKELKYGVSVVRNVGKRDNEPYDNVKIKKVLYPSDMGKKTIDIVLSDEIRASVEEADKV